jgi:hypothetical protein
MFIFGCKQGSTLQPSPVKEKTEPVSKLGRPQEPPRFIGVTEQKIGPRIEFEKTLHNFGDIAPGTWNICEFKFKNTGNEILRVGKIAASCGCTAATLTKNDYEPGEEGVVRVKYHSDLEPGPKSRQMYVTSNDKEQPRVRLIIDAHIIYKVAFEPERFDLQLDKDNAGCPEVVLESKDGKPFSVTSVRSSKNCITAEFDPKLEATKIVLQPKVDIDVLKENLSGEVDFGLSHPECRVVKIPYLAKPFFRFSPLTLTVFDAGERNTTEKEVMLYSNYDTDFEIDSTSSEKGFVKVLDMKKFDKQYKLVLEIMTPESSQDKRLFSDTLIVTMKDGEKAKLFCRGFYKKKPSAVK